MNRNTSSKALGFGTMIIGAALVVGCQAAGMSAAEASEAGREVSESSAASIDVAPADRKFFNEGYLYGWDGSRPTAEEQEIHPADIKFFEAGATVVEPIHPADIKFYNWSSSRETDLQELYESLHPADRKFLDMVEAR